MRRRNCKNAAVRLAAFDQIMISNPQENLGKWSTVFGNDHPIHIEIGMGKGKFIFEQALKNPDINYIGIEKFDSVILQAAKKSTDLTLSNLKLICYDASLLTSCFSDQEVSKIYLNFSDPWPKKAHAKRRLTSPIFLKQYQQILKKDGDIEFKTDNRLLFEYSLTTFWEQQLGLLDLSLDLHQTGLPIITTEYEDRFTQLGQPIYFIKVKFNE